MEGGTREGRGRREGRRKEEGGGEQKQFGMVNSICCFSSELSCPYLS